MLDAKKGMTDKEQTKEMTETEASYQKVILDDEWANFQSFISEDMSSKAGGWKKKVDQKQFKNGYKCTVH